jgi:hypothetical protein
VPELVGLGSERLLVVGRDDAALGIEIGEVNEIGSGSESPDLGDLQRSEAARIGELDVVGDLLVPKHQQRVFLEGGTQLGVQFRMLGDIGDRRAARLDAETGTERNKFHAVPSLVPPVGIEPT